MCVGTTGVRHLNAAKDQHRADQIFTEALDRPPSSRLAFIESACGEDAELRSEVENLLDHYSSAEDALTRTRTTHRISGRSDVEQVDLRTESGLTVGTCRLDGQLHDDGMFERWATRHSDDRPAAVLSLARQRLSTDDARRISLGAETLLRLDHPGLPRVLEAGTVDLGRGPEGFFLIEKVEGRSLADGPAQSTAELRRRMTQMVDVCEAVQELHFHGLAHGRLTPARIVICESGNARLTDPGLLPALATAIPDSAAAEQLRNIPGAPERAILSPVSLDGRIDVFDLGGLLLRWCGDLTGTLAEQARGIALRATAHDRGDRFRAAGDLGDALNQVLNPSAAGAAAEDEHSAKLTPLATAMLLAVAAAVGFTLGAMLI